MASMSATDLWQAQSADLAALEERARLRRLARQGVDFASNDYRPGAIAAPAPRWPMPWRVAWRWDRADRARCAATIPSTKCWRPKPPRSSTAKRAVVQRGLCRQRGADRTLPQRGDLVIYDDLIHASVHEGLRLTRAQTAMATHNDADAFDSLARAWRAAGNMGRLWLCVESLYSMDGDRAPLDDLVTVAERHGGILVIDEAHATGVFGPDGRGLAAHLDGRPDVVCCARAARRWAAEGALVCGPRVVRDFLVNRGRPFIFSTAPSP
jgi:8-amino-7-oxononanoate synthase